MVVGNVLERLSEKGSLLFYKKPEALSIRNYELEITNWGNPI
jgi:hypothetical protein